MFFMDQLRLLFSNTFFLEETVVFSKIRTRIVGVEGEHADHKGPHDKARIFLTY